MSRASGRAVVLVLDGVGAGALPDAAAYGDADACTLGHVAQLLRLRLPLLQRLGLGNIVPMRGVPPAAAPQALPARLAEESAGKDSTTGHWEHMGLVKEAAFPTYPLGFPLEVVSAFERAIGREVIGNKVASGTEVIQELGPLHLKTGRPILYTSQDSVFQVAAHVDVVPLQTLYEWCRTARRLLSGPHGVARVIARPFGGGPEALERVPGRKDFSLAPPGPTYLDMLLERGLPVTGVGKVGDLFADRGFSSIVRPQGNEATLRAVRELLVAGTSGLILANLIDFDMEWGHRNDAELFARGLGAFDRSLPGIMALLCPADRLLITADHGCDPTTPSTDHTREYAPLLLWPRPEQAGPGPACYQGYFSDVGATVYHVLTGEAPALRGRAVDHVAPARGWTSPLRRAAERRRPPAAEPRAAARVLRHAFGEPPAAAIVLGSGFDTFASEAEPSGPDALAFTHLPGWPGAAVVGHSGLVRLGITAGRHVLLVCGRGHGYEGHVRRELQQPLLSLARWGVRSVVLTCAVGSLSPRLPVPGFAVVGDVLDLQRGAPRCSTPARLDVSSRRSRRFARTTGLPTVSYAAVPGPQYETAAEAAVLRHLGCDVVGMSAVAEAEAALRLRMEMLMLVLVTNAAGAVSGPGLPAGADIHEEVVAGGRAATARLGPYLEQWWPILEGL